MADTDKATLSHDELPLGRKLVHEAFLRHVATTFYRLGMESVDCVIGNNEDEDEIHIKIQLRNVLTKKKPKKKSKKVTKKKASH